MTLYSWKGSVDPDESYWVESGKSGKSFLNIIRLFYEGAPPAHEQIGTFLSLLFIYLFQHCKGGQLKDENTERYECMETHVQTGRKSNVLLFNIVNVPCTLIVISSISPANT